MTNLRRFMPTSKVSAGVGLGLPLTILAAGALSRYGITLSPEEAGALGAVIAGIVAWFKKENRPTLQEMSKRDENAPPRVDVS
jgi:hypothetical protein